MSRRARLIATLVQVVLWVVTLSMMGTGAITSAGGGDGGPWFVGGILAGITMLFVFFTGPEAA